MIALSYYSTHYCAITIAGLQLKMTTMNSPLPWQVVMMTMMLLLLLLPTDADVDCDDGADFDAAGADDDYWVRLTFDADVRYTRVKLDADLRRNCTMHHTVRRERDWVGDQCLMVVSLEMLTPFHRWTNNLMHKY